MHRDRMQVQPGISTGEDETRDPTLGPIVQRELRRVRLTHWTATPQYDDWSVIYSISRTFPWYG